VLTDALWHFPGRKLIFKSAHVFDDLDELVHAVALATGEVDELSSTLDDNTTFGRPCNRNATPASELE
jgi:hypothetical protein